jgi:hypothetical protein
MKVLAELFGGKEAYNKKMFGGGEFVGVEGYIRNLALALLDASQSQKNFTLASISTANELPILTALVTEEINAMKGLATQTKDVQTTQQQAAEYFAKNWERLSGSWNAVVGSLQRALEGLKIQVGAVFADALTPFVERVNEVIDAIKEWVRNNPALVKSLGEIAGMAGAVAAVSGAVLILGGTLMSMAAVASVVAGAFGPLVPLMVAVSGSIAALAKAFVDNVDYIGKRAAEAFKNISSVMSTTDDFFLTAADAVKQIIQPVSELFGLIVRMGADMMVVFSQIAKGLADFNNALGGAPMKAFLQAIGILVAMKTLRGLATLVTMVTGLGRAWAITMTAFNVAGAMRAASAIEGVTGRVAGLTAGIRTLYTAVGPLGIATMVLGAAYIAYETFPPLHDFIDGLTSRYRDLKKEVKEVTQAFDGMAAVMADITLKAGDNSLAINGLSDRLAQEAKAAPLMVMLAAPPALAVVVNVMVSLVRVNVPPTAVMV